MNRQVGRLFDWWTHKCTDWLTDGQTGGQIGWLMDRQVGRLVDRWTDRWTDWLTDKQIGGQIGWLIVSTAVPVSEELERSQQETRKTLEDSERIKADLRGTVCAVAWVTAWEVQFALLLERYSVCYCLRGTVCVTAWEVLCVCYCLRGTVCITAWEVLCVCYCLRDTVCITVWETQCVLLFGRNSVCYCLGLDVAHFTRRDWLHVAYNAIWLSSCGLHGNMTDFMRLTSRHDWLHVVYAVTWQTTRVLLHRDMTDTRVLLYRDMTDTRVLLHCDMTDNTCFITLWLDRHLFAFIYFLFKKIKK